MVEDQNNFLTRIKNLKSYIIKFEEDSIKKSKMYPSDCIVKGNDCQSIIVLTQSKYTRVWINIYKSYRNL